MQNSSSFTLSSSFKKKQKTVVHDSKYQPTILTSKISSNLLTVRTGSADLDALLGGGYVLGALTLVIEDRPSQYWTNLIQAGISDALCNGQRVFVKERKESELLKNLPVPGKKSQDKMSDGDHKLTIAWRYGKQTKANLSVADPDTFYYYSYSRSLKNKDIAKEEEEQEEEQSSLLPNLFCWGGQELKISELIEIYSAQLKSEQDSTLARVIVPSLLVDSYPKLQQVRDLKVLTRSLNASTVLTISKQFTPTKFMNCLLSLADCVIELTSFYNDEVASAAYPDYDGALHLVKLPSLNSLNCLPLKITQLGGRRTFIYKASLQRSVSITLNSLSQMYI